MIPKLTYNGVKYGEIKMSRVMLIKKKPVLPTLQISSIILNPPVLKYHL